MRYLICSFLVGYSILVSSLKAEDPKVNQGPLLPSPASPPSPAATADMSQPPQADMKSLIFQSRRGVVSLKSRLNKAAYNPTQENYGSGFVVDKKLGLILTNRHMVGSGSSGTYEITFFNGREAEADVLHYDLWQDIAFLKVNPKEIPAEVEELPLAPMGAQQDQTIFIIGKNAGQNFSFQTGTISSLFESTVPLSSQIFRISLNARGGSSGSPVLNLEGKVIGMLFASNMDNFALAIPIEYANDALDKLRRKEKIQRKNAGIVVSYYSLDQALKYSEFPQSLIENYIRKYPDSYNRAIQIQEVFRDSPAHGKLKSGDIIWKVNGVEIGPNLYFLEKLMDTSPNNKVSFEIYRDGKLLKQEVGLYDIEKTKIKRMLSFGGAVFYEADDLVRRNTGVKSGKVFLTNVRTGSSFYERFPTIPGTNIFFLHIEEMDGKKVNSLDDLIKIIPDLMKKKNFRVIYKNLGCYSSFAQMLVFSRVPVFADVTYDPLDGTPEEFILDTQTGKWNVHLLEGKQKK